MFCEDLTQSDYLMNMVEKEVVGRPGGLITEITWKAGKWLPIIDSLSIPILQKASMTLIN